VPSEATFLGALDVAAREALTAVARPVTFAPGATLVRQGQATLGAYVLETGTVEAFVSLPGGQSMKVAELSDGSVFGEMALIERGMCSATVIARTAVTGWYIGGDDFRATVASRNRGALEIQRTLARNLSDKLHALNAKLAGHPAAEDRAADGEAPQGDPLAGIARTRQASFDWRAFLPVLPFFEGFDAFEIDEMVASASALELPRGAWLFAAGQPAQACYLVVRGAVEVFTRTGGRQRRVAIAGPGELVGYISALRGDPHGANARVREGACVLEIPREPFLALYNGSSSASVSLLHGIHRSLLRAMARTNTQLTRLITHSRLQAAAAAEAELESALHGQIWRPAE
jgi:CRP-like cAMP-binding protein